MKSLVDIVSWEVRDIPDAENVSNAIGIGGRYCWYYVDGSDMYNLAFFRDKVTDEEAAEEECKAFFDYINS